NHDRAKDDLPILNLDTVITPAKTAWPYKVIHYRMHPQNIGCLSAGRIDACPLANNHVLDWGYDGLSETLQTLDAAGMAHSGAGNDAAEAMQPAVLDRAENGGLLFFSFALTISGIRH